MSNGREDFFSRKDREFFERLFTIHDRIESFTKSGDREYLLRRTRGDEVIVHLTGKYTFGSLDLFELHAAQPSVNCVVSASSFLNYTADAKEEGLRLSIGVFSIKEFMGAMNFAEFWNYVPRSD